jgi:hypothetical protein
MRHPSEVQHRMERVGQSRIHEFLTRKSLVLTNPTEHQSTIMLKVTAQSIIFGHLIPSVIQQLRQDIALCASMDVDEEAWKDHAFENTVHLQLRKSIKQLAAGLSQTEWDRWAKLEELDPEWVHFERDCEETITLRVEAPQTVQSSNVQRGDSLMDNQSKAYLDLLLPHRPEKVVDTRIRTELAVDEEKDNPFDLYSRSGRIWRETPFRPKKSKIKNRKSSPQEHRDANGATQTGHKRSLPYVYPESSIPSQSNYVNEKGYEKINEQKKPKIRNGESLPYERRDTNVATPTERERFPSHSYPGSSHGHPDLS